MRQSLRLGRFAGVDVGVNWSVLVIFALLTWELATVVFPPLGASGPSAADWVAAVVAAVAFFASLLAHEVSHAVVARRNDVGVRSITLWLFGGVAQLDGEAHAPGADFRIAAVGPATSIVLAVVFAVGQLAAQAAGSGGLVTDTAAWLWRINLLLAGFNLIPAAPLDGGRILRALLWRVWGDRSRAGVAAARAGRGFGVVLIGVGVVEFASFGAVGLWPALLGWFLFSAAGLEERTARLRGGLARLRVGQVMTPAPPAVAVRITVAEVVDGVLWRHRGAAVAVTDDHGWLAGVVTVTAVEAVPNMARSTTTLAAIAVPLSAVPVARADESLDVLYERMMRSPGTPALVLSADNRLAGMVTAADLARAATLTGAPPPGVPTQRPTEQGGDGAGPWTAPGAPPSSWSPQSAGR